MGRHWEKIHFVVAPKMTEVVILGLSWLDKWAPTIWSEGGERKLRLGIGPLPPPRSPEKGAVQRLEDTKRMIKQKSRLNSLQVFP